MLCVYHLRYTAGDQAVLDAAEPAVREFITSIPGTYILYKLSTTVI